MGLSRHYKICHPATFSIQTFLYKLNFKHEILHVYVVLYALSDYRTEKLISDDSLVTWSRDQLLQKAYYRNHM